MAEIIAILIIVYAVKSAVEDSRSHWRKSKAAHRKSKAGASRSRRIAADVHYRTGYWTSQVLTGFPQARHGLAIGWHAGRQSQVQVRAEREKAKGEHLQARASVIEQIREHRKQQQAALERIRGMRQPVTGTEPLPVTAAGEPAGKSRREPAASPAGTYSYGPAAASAGWPADDLYEARERARTNSAGGKPWIVTGYPPGGGPGKRVATYAGGEEQPPEAVRDAALPAGCPACGAVPGEPCTGSRTCEARINESTEEGSAGGGKAAANGTSPATAGHPENTVAGPESPSTEGSSGMATAADTTYDQTVAAMAANRDNAEQAATGQQQAYQQANQIAEAAQGLDLDPGTLSALADHLDAHQAAVQALLLVQETAENVQTTLQRGHAGLNAAHQDAPVDAADKNFYAG